MGKSGIVVNVCTGVVAVVASVVAFFVGNKLGQLEDVRKLKDVFGRLPGAKQSDIAGLKKTIEIRNGQIKDLKKIIEINEGRIKDLKKLIEIKDGQIKDLNDESLKLDAANRKLTAANLRLSAENHGLKVDNEKLREWYAKSRNYSSLLEEVRNEINKRAFDKDGNEQCWNFDEMIECLVKYRPNVGTEQNDETTLEGRIKKLKTCKERLEDMVRDEKGKYKEKIDSINCEEARKLIGNLINARENLFAACVEGYEGEMGRDLRDVVAHLSSYAGKILNKEGNKVEDSSSADASTLEGEINELLKWLLDNADKAWTYTYAHRSDAEVELYKMIGEIADCFREE